MNPRGNFTCEFYRQIRPTDELIAVNGRVICEPQRFGAVQRIIAKAPRPLTLTFVQGLDRDAAFARAEAARTAAAARAGMLAGGACCRAPGLDVLNDPALDAPGASGAWAARPRGSSVDSEASVDAPPAAPPSGARDSLALFFLCNSVACDAELEYASAEASPFCYADAANLEEPGFATPPKPPSGRASPTDSEATATSPSGGDADL